MPRKCVCVALVAIFALAAARSAQAQVMVDVAKVNCDQFVHHKISEPRLIAAWLSGYYHVHSELLLHLSFQAWRQHQL